MSIIELFIIAVGLSMDAFAVAICKGLCMAKMKWKDTILTGLYFGGFQAGMPLVGYLLGVSFKRYITSFDHWIAFALLLFIGFNMIKESREEDEKEGEEYCFCHKNMLILSVATSIDALAVGVTFAFLHVQIVPAVSMIGVVTFLLSMIGVKVGTVFGIRFKSKAELAGGIILIAMGFKILLEHLGILNF